MIADFYFIRGNLFVHLLLCFIFNESKPFQPLVLNNKLLAITLFFTIRVVTFVYLISVFFCEKKSLRMKGYFRNLT